MKTCKICGTEIDVENKFCHNCGTSIDAEVEVEIGYPKKPFVEQPIQKAMMYRQPLIARNFWYWYLLSLLVRPVMFVYLYFNFDDLKKLEEYDRSGEFKLDSKSNPVTMLVLMLVGTFTGLSFILFPIVYYQKFKKLDRFIKLNSLEVEKKPTSGELFLAFYLPALIVQLVAIIVMYLYIFDVFYVSNIGYDIFLVILGFTFLVLSIISLVYYLTQFHLWQKAYNEIAYKLCPETDDRGLF